ncbi:DNA N-6-adenine-methyltransferase [uncultured Megasphaera sp.]|jgi:phage N-6-adenine-methyltransferase|uniref:DNA N-6-adenine-methyltransferase n=1 Tax=uncultured Megasphaera sp. TaxID=165188 RepID=UPI002590EA8F|nr:DNA N-6-adenine-methyltransferase [uncultured Megasphaera sp.]
MAINNILYSSESEVWETPQALFNKLNDEFHFDIDVCATPENAKCCKFFSPLDDGLSQDWQGVCWMNPPYGKKIVAWMKKALEAETTVVCLVPSRTDTKWWHEYAMKASEIRFIKGRLKFGDSKNSAPFPSAIIVFGKTHKDLKVCSMERG